MLEQCNVCLYGHFRGDLFSQISLPHENRENKLIDLQYSNLMPRNVQPVPVNEQVGLSLSYSQLQDLKGYLLLILVSPAIVIETSDCVPQFSYIFFLTNRPRSDCKEAFLYTEADLFQFEGHYSSILDVQNLRTLTMFANTVKPV